MTRLNRIREVEAEDGWKLPVASDRSGWIVVSGSGPSRPVSREMVEGSGLQLVEPQCSEASHSKYDPVALSSSRVTPRWLKVMWVASVVISGWALYWVSLSA